MSAVGRNDPCPCGSGLKFKKCCLNKNLAVVPSYRASERDSALAKLVRFAARDEFNEEHKEAQELFWGDWLLEEPDEQLDAVIKSEQVNIAYHSWFAYDFELSEGLTVLDLFLEREAKRLSTGELNYLEGMLGSHSRLYEVLEVRLDQGFELRDLWNDRRLFVRERSATRQLVAWDLVVGRIGLSGDGGTVLETLTHLFPASAKDELLNDLRRAHRDFTRRYDEKSTTDFFRWVAPSLHQWWLERVALPPRPKILTSDGTPFVFAKVVFDLLNRDAVISALADRDDMVDHGDGSYAWLEPAGNLQRSVGTIIIEGRRLRFETTSQKRAERARDFLSGLFSENVKFRAISYEDVEQALKHAPQRAENKAPDIPLEEQQRVLGEFYEQHYRKWLDEPVPALGNRTPRHAAKLKTVRPKLITLLKDFESHSERLRRSGEIADDFSWMWAELGLTRE